MTFKYTEEQLNKLDKELVISLFLGMQMFIITARPENVYMLHFRSAEPSAVPA